jgi:hypothetical protein
MQIRKRGGRKLIETGVLAFIKEMAPAKKITRPTWAVCCD